MLAIEFTISNVVHDINKTRTEAKCEESAERQSQVIQIEQMLRKDERREDEHIFRPLQWAQKTKYGFGERHAKERRFMSSALSVEHAESITSALRKKVALPRQFRIPTVRRVRVEIFLIPSAVRLGLHQMMSLRARSNPV